MAVQRGSDQAVSLEESISADLRRARATRSLRDETIAMASIDAAHLPRRVLIPRAQQDHWSDTERERPCWLTAAHPWAIG
jgi:hypothetical protein